MAMSGGNDDGEPMMEMNTTPLIDVMLVLLIMFIITIPVATHAVPIDLPSPSPPTDVPPIEPIKNKLVLRSDDNAILWNGNVISENDLVTLLEQTKSVEPEPELQFQPEERASYEIANRVLKIIKYSGVSKFGFVGNEQFRDFGK